MDHVINDVLTLQTHDDYFALEKQRPGRKRLHLTLAEEEVSALRMAASRHGGHRRRLSYGNGDGFAFYSEDVACMIAIDFPRFHPGPACDSSYLHLILLSGAEMDRLQDALESAHETAAHAMD